MAVPLRYTPPLEIDHCTHNHTFGGASLATSSVALGGMLISQIGLTADLIPLTSQGAILRHDVRRLVATGLLMLRTARGSQEWL